MTKALIVACAAPPVLRISELIASMKQRGWQASLVLTPTASSWIDPEGLACNTNALVRVNPRMPYESKDDFGSPDLIVVAPLTFNTLNKWAAGISDTLALGILNEALGSPVPIRAVTCIKESLTLHPAYANSVRLLQASGVNFIDPEPMTIRAEDGMLNFIWDQLL